MPAPQYAIDAVQHPLDPAVKVWNPPGAPTLTVTYSFESAQSSQFTTNYTGWEAWTEADKDAVRWGFTQYASVGNLTFVEQAPGSPDPDIVIGKVELGYNEARWTYSFTTGPDGNVTSKSFDAQVVFNRDTDMTNYGTHRTVLHELGHALMNKHTGNYDATGGTPPPPYLPAAEDNATYSVMSYNSGPYGQVGFALELYDIAAIQARFGANYNSRTGDDNYTFDTVGDVYSIWDTAGFDTIDATFAGNRVNIDLTAGHFSLLGNAAYISIAYGVVIEGATGSRFNDTLTGNDANNRLSGGAGDDLLDGGYAYDTAVYGGQRADFSWSANSDQSLTVTDLRANRPEGIDTLRGIEALKFLDQTVTLAAPPPNAIIGFTGTTNLQRPEGNTTAATFSYTVARSGTTSGESQVSWTVSARNGGGELTAQDFAGGVMPAGVLTFAAGETAKTITLTTAPDKTIETDDGFQVTLSAPVGATLAGGGSLALGTIYNDDNGSAANARISIDAGGPMTKSEGNVGTTSYDFVISRYDDVSGTSTIGWVVEPGHVTGAPAAGTDAADFASPLSGTVTFAPGQAETAIHIQVQGDNTVEPDEGFTVRLSNPQNAYVMDTFRPGMNGKVSAIVTNDDSGQTATGNVYNSPAPGSTVVAGSGDDTINASQGPDVLTGGAGRDTFAWAKEPWSPATITDFVVGTDRIDFSALFQTAGYTGSDPVADKYIYLTAQGSDTLVQFDHDGTGPSPQWPNYILKLQGVAQANPTWSQLSGSGSPPPPGSASLSLGGETGPNHVEGPAGQVSVKTFTVYRSGDLNQTSTVQWAVGPGNWNGHPVNGADFVGGSLPAGALTFNPGEGQKTFDVRVAGDAAFEPDEGYTIGISNPTGATLSGTMSRQITIPNDDADTTPSDGRVYNSPGPGSRVVAGAGDDTINASQGPDILTGGGGRDTFAWAKEPWSPATITDFVVGTDRLNFSALFQTAGYTGADPVADHYIVLTTQGADTLVQFDHDGTGPSPQWPNYILKLEGVAQPGLTWAQLAGSGAPPPPSQGQVLTSPGPGSTVTGGAGNDTLVASQGPDVLTGAGGGDAFTFRAVPWNAGHVTDFAVGTDRLDFSAMFQASGYSGADPVADGRMRFDSDGAGGTQVYFDRDAANGGDWPFLITTLDHVAPAGLTWARLSAGGGSEPPPSNQGRVLTWSQNGDTLTGGAGNDTLNASRGPDRLTGAGGADQFAWADAPWNAGHVTDFTPGTDKLDLRALFDASGYAGGDPVLDGRLEFRADGAGATQVYFDADQPGSGQWPWLITTLDNVRPDQISHADWLA